MQEDNDPKHSSKSAAEWLKHKRIRRLQLPSQAVEGVQGSCEYTKVCKPQWTGTMLLVNTANIPPPQPREKLISLTACGIDGASLQMHHITEMVFPIALKWWHHWKGWGRVISPHASVTSPTPHLEYSEARLTFSPSDTCQCFHCCSWYCNASLVTLKALCCHLVAQPMLSWAEMRPYACMNIDGFINLVFVHAHPCVGFLLLSVANSSDQFKITHTHTQ